MSKVSDTSSTSLQPRLFSFNGTSFTEIDSISLNGHTKAGNSLGNYNGNLFVTGGFNGTYHSETEILYSDNQQFEWRPQEAYPFHQQQVDCIIFMTHNRLQHSLCCNCFFSKSSCCNWRRLY